MFVHKEEKMMEPNTEHFESDCLDILGDNHNICLYFPSRSAENSPRSKIVVFQITEELIESFPELRPILTPITSTNASIYVIEPIFYENDDDSDDEESGEMSQVYCNTYIIYGSSIEKKKVEIDGSLEALEKYLSSSLKIFPFSTDLHIEKAKNMINDMEAKDFLEYIRSLYIL